MRDCSLTVVVGIWHPLELTEEATSKELALHLGLSHCKVLLYTLLRSFEQLVRCKFEGQLADRLVC